MYLNTFNFGVWFKEIANVSDCVNESVSQSWEYTCILNILNGLK